MPTFKLTIAYDGSAYVGWQRQPTGPSVQSLLETACGELAGVGVTVRGAGRTDAGVHARGQVASVAIDRAIDGATFARALNWRLPATVRVLEAVEVPDEFDPRFDARRKVYRYRILNADVLSPFERAYVWHVPSPDLAVEPMAEAAQLVCGTHDFAAFQGKGAATHGTDRTIFASHVSRDPVGNIITYDVSGDGFLRHMVRNLVGSLVEVGRGRRRAAWIADLLASRNRTQAGPTAPPQGLFLMAVEYE